MGHAEVCVCRASGPFLPTERWVTIGRLSQAATKGASVERNEQLRGTKSPARPSAAAKHWDFEQEETEKTEVIALLSVLSVDSCSKKCAQPAHVLTFCSAKKGL
jgi:hypothetical protein